MTYKVRRVSRDSVEFREVLRSLLTCKRMGPGRFRAVQACMSVENSRLLVAYFKSGRTAGAMSFRPRDGLIKRINTGAVKRRSGVGTALLKYLIRWYPDYAMCSNNVGDGVKFVKAIGMKRLKKWKDGKIGHTWTAAQARKWAKEKA